MFERSILAISGQLAEATISLALFLAGLLTSIVGSLGWVSSSAETQFYLAVAGIFVALGASIYGVTSIRCPKYFDGGLLSRRPPGEPSVWASARTAACAWTKI